MDGYFLAMTVLDVIRTVEPIPFDRAHRLQREFHTKRVANQIPDTLWLLEHPAVITTGVRRDQASNILVNPSDVGVDVVHTERGGEVTYHGPGQLMGYLFIDMAGFGFQVRNFIRRIEDCFISYLEASHGITARHDEHRTGVWVDMDKIVAIGIALRRKVTMHGFAFNVSTNLEHFNWIVPCGIGDTARGVTSLEKLSGTRPCLGQVAEDMSLAFRTALGYASGKLILKSMECLSL